ncbi:hypothetical protein AWB78_08039 [Caballeronia calidae]|uniref:Uncharacterized protein n=1 Tax=Caballeronia calidae TaxID=1777139 RepID=A0A158EHR9_9BURK|nr:hypothetical protein AWB78_08039 [Caballeronia calidae]
MRFPMQAAVFKNLPRIDILSRAARFRCDSGEAVTGGCLCLSPAARINCGLSGLGRVMKLVPLRAALRSRWAAHFSRHLHRPLMAAVLGIGTLCARPRRHHRIRRRRGAEVSPEAQHSTAPVEVAVLGVSVRGSRCRSCGKEVRVVSNGIAAGRSHRLSESPVERDCVKTGAASRRVCRAGAANSRGIGLRSTKSLLQLLVAPA